MRKRIVYLCFLMLFIFAVLLFVLFIVNFKKYEGKRPSDQPETAWVSEDGNLYFKTDENGAGIGKITIGDDSIDVYVGMGPSIELAIYPASALDEKSITGTRYEFWECNYVSSGEFIATVVETTFYEKDQKIKIYKIDSSP